MSKISAVELAALDQVAWQISLETYSKISDGRFSSEDDQVEKRIQHFLYVRGHLIDGLLEGSDFVYDGQGMLEIEEEEIE